MCGLQRGAAVEQVGDLLGLPASCADHDEPRSPRIFGDEFPPGVQQQQMVFPRLDRAKHQEIRMTPPDRVGLRRAPAALERRGKRLYMNRSWTRSLAMKFLLEAPLDRPRRNDEGARMEKRGGKPPAKDPEVGGGEKLRVIKGQKIVKHEDIAEVVSPLEPLKKLRIFEQVLRNIEIDRARRDAELAIVEDAAPQLLKASRST